MAIFVDGANLYYCQRDELGWRIDWGALVSYYRREYDVVEVFYYRAVRTSPGDDDADFSRMLVFNGYTLREKPLKEIADLDSGQNMFKGNMDVELTIDALNTSARYDACLLISGDGDFAALVEALRHRGKAVSVLSTSGSVAFELRSAVGLNFQDLRILRSKIEYLPRTGSGPDIEGAEQHQDVLAGSETGSLAEGIDGPTIGYSTERKAGSEVETSVGAIVTRVSGAGVALTTSDGNELYMPVTNLRLTRFVSDLPTIIQIGEGFSVIAVGFDERRFPPTKIVKLANEAERDRLQKRLDELAPTFDELPSEGEFELEVQAVKHFGAFLKNSWYAQTLLHVSALNLGQVADCTSLVRPGDRIRIRVTGKEQRVDGPRIFVALADEVYRQMLLTRLKDASTS